MRADLIPAPQHRKQHWRGVSGSALSWALAEAAQSHNKPLLFIAESPQVAHDVETALQFFLRRIPILHFSDWETLPYDHFSPQREIVSSRLRALHQCGQLSRYVLITSLNTAIQRICPPQFLHHYALQLHCGMQISLPQLLENLTRSGYQPAEIVEEPGSFARRGAIVDFFPMGMDSPLRVEWFDDTIDSIRTFDPQNQRTIDRVESIASLPAHEFPFDETARTRFESAWFRHFPRAATRAPLLLAVKKGIAAAGMDYYLPLFFSRTAHLFEFLPADTLIVAPHDIVTRQQQFLTQVTTRYEALRHDVMRPLLQPEALFLNQQELQQAMRPFTRVGISVDGVGHGVDFGARALPEIILSHRHRETQLRSFLDTYQEKYRILFALGTKTRLDLIAHLLSMHTEMVEYPVDWDTFFESDARCSLIHFSLPQGFIHDDARIVVVSERELFGQISNIQQQKRRKADAEASIHYLAELDPGALVVHARYGIGRYLGLESFAEQGVLAEFLKLVYAHDAELFLPVNQLHLLSRYSGIDAENVTLDHLGSKRWTQACAKAHRQVRDHAADLLKIYAQRAHHQGLRCTKPSSEYTDFCTAFPYPLTTDQQRAITEMERDLQSDKAMDRLICGDVGFGKTEVAMRAAFLAAENGYQVAILTPTTLLVQQHAEVFGERFEDTPFTLETLSRFSSSRENAAVIEKISLGKVNIVIGTHALLQQKVQFSNLGLVVIDEEHRFGVKQKERFKQLRAEVDVLALTATPIPRTLNISLAGVSDLSIISSPPTNRHAIRTFIHEYSESLIREAIAREMLRAGQVYFLHNRVETIEQRAEELQQLLPQLRLGVAHGKMRETMLEHTMRDFYHQRFDVLVCTTIIETGIDVPNANTILIERADRFGLAQLHQLRGRVGRSDRQAYAYLLTPPPQSLTRDAQRRLEAIAQAQQLGAGFTLATHDLEIRGAGELLGAKQSGTIERVGFSMYQKLLAQAVKALQDGVDIGLETTDENVDIDLGMTAILPDDYVADVPQRLIFYKRLAEATSDGIEALRAELQDRFGPLPEAATQLLAQNHLRCRAEPLGVKRITANARGASIRFHALANVDPAKLVALVQQEPLRYRLHQNDRLDIVEAFDSSQARVDTLMALLGTLAAT